MSKIKLSKKTKLILSHISVLIIGIAIGSCLIWGIDKYKASKENNDSNKESESSVVYREDIKESPYTLEELYDIVEDPERFYKENGPIISYYNLVMFHFYDYFSKTTPVKVATKVETDDAHRVTKVLEVEYIDYYEFQRRMELGYKFEKEFIEKDLADGFNYRMFVEDLIYPTRKDNLNF